MKTLAQGPPARRKIILIFILAILLPALVLGYLSLGAYSKRREAVRRLLESNLWISGESTLRAVEAALLDREEAILGAISFSNLTSLKTSVPTVDPQDTTNTAFLLDEEFLILFPAAGVELPESIPVEENSSGGEFLEAFQRAEAYELSQRNFDRAAQAYRESAALASSDWEKATALAALGRCLISAGNLTEARRIYDELGEKYGMIRDRAGHFFGMTTALQRYEIDIRRKQEKDGLQALLELYQGLQNGEWPVSLAEYDFFTAEINSAFDANIRKDELDDIVNSYRDLKRHASPYLQSLLFVEFLKKDVIPKIRERVGISSVRGSLQTQPDRLLVSRSDGYCLISYSPFQDPNDKRTYYRGFCWDLESVKTEILPKVLGGISKETGLELENVAGSRTGSPEATQDVAASDSLSLPYRLFPLPWKLLVTQPELDELERTAQQENLLYGALLAFIMVLMFFGAILLGRDISREAETTRLKMEFVHNISHELKTPLTLIRLYGETLQRKKNLAEKDRSESYEIITKESERLSHLINNVLDFSRIEMGRKEFKFKNDSPSRVVQETLDSYRYHLERKGFEVHDRIDPDLPETSFDAEAVASILVNLLSNAMKFSADRKEVTVRLFRRDRWAVLEVEDKGIGIARQNQGEIFEKFFRVKQGAASRTQGSGLGLALVKHIVEAHGGTVEAESELGKGSTFSILLPLSGSDGGEVK